MPATVAPPTGVAITAPIPDPKVFDNFFGRIAMEVDPHLEAHPVGVMTSLMAYGSAMVPDSSIKTREGELRLGFWPILCGISGGGGKGKATTAAKKILDLAFKGWGAGHIKAGFDTGLGLIKVLFERLDEEGKSPPLVIFENEVSKLIRALGSDGRMGGVFTNLADNDDLRYSSGTGEMDIKDPYAVILAHVQPKLFLKTRGTNAASMGAWNRFLFFWVEKSKTLGMFTSIEEYEATNRRMADVFALGVSRAQRPMGRATDDAETNRRKVVKVPQDVAVEFEKFHRPRIESLVNSSEEMNEYAQRGLAYLLKVAALYCIFDGRDTATIADFDSALALLEYAIASLRFMLSNATKFSGRTTLATKIRAFVELDGPCQYTAMTIKLGRKTPKASYRAALRELVDEVYVYTRPRRPGQRGQLPEWLSTVEQGIPEDAIMVDLNEDATDDADDGQDPSAHDKYAATGTEVKAEQVDAPDQGERFAGRWAEEPVDAEVVEDESAGPQVPLSRPALTAAPSRARAAHRPVRADSEPLKTTQEPTEQRENGTSTSTRPPKRPRVARPDGVPTGQGWF